MNINGTVAAVTANALNQYTQVRGNTLQYDGNFNLKVYGAFGFNYDAEKRLTRATKSGVTQVECTYDGLGRVVRRIEQGVTTLYTYDEWKPIVEWDGSGTMVAWNVYGAGADEILWRWRAGVGYLRYHADRMGNVTSVLDLAGNLTEQYTYDAFGQTTILSANNTPLLTSAIGNRFMFTGREYLSSIVSYDYRHRMYRPNLGRFLQSDPIGFDAGDMNLFRYVGGDPVDRSDPTGLLAVDWTWSKRMYEQGNAQDSFNDILQQYFNQSGGVTIAHIRNDDTGRGKSISSREEGAKGGVTVPGGTREDHQLVQSKTDKVLGTPRGRQLLARLHKEHKWVNLHVFRQRGDSDGAYTLPNFRDVYIDPSYHPEVLTTAGWIRACTERNIAHELGHAVTHDSPSRYIEHILRNMDNINHNENPIMRFLGEPARISPD